MLMLVLLSLVSLNKVIVCETAGSTKWKCKKYADVSSADFGKFEQGYS